MRPNPAEARATLERLLGPATVVVRSGGRWKNPGSGNDEDKIHLHWRLARPARGAELVKLKRAREHVARTVGSDPSNVPICHPIRWPGSWHRKAEPRLCEILAVDPDREIELEIALAVLGERGQEVRSSEKEEVAAADNDRVDWAKSIQQIISGSSYHPALVPLAASCASHRVPQQAADKLLRALLANSAPSDPERERRRQSELSKLPDTVASAYRKFGEPEAATPFDPWERYIVPTFPLDILPTIARAFVSEQAAVIGCDASGLAMAVLAAFSGALHHNFALKMMRHGSWYERPRLWVLLIADPSQRKTPIMKAATLPLVQYEARLREKYEEELRRFEVAEAQKADGLKGENRLHRRAMSFGIRPSKSSARSWLAAPRACSSRVMRFRAGLVAWNVMPTAVGAPIAPSGCRPTTADPTVSTASGAAKFLSKTFRCRY